MKPLSILAPRKPAIGISMSSSSNDEEEDDDGLGEEDFLESERKFQRDIEILEAKKPPPILQNPIIVSLLTRIQLLSMIIHDDAPRDKITDDAEMIDGPFVAEKHEGLPLPQHVLEKERTPSPVGRQLKDPALNPIPTPPVEELPFLCRSENARQFRQFEAESEDEALNDAIEHHLGTAVFGQRDFLENLYVEYQHEYKPWKHRMIIEQRLHVQKAMTPVPPSPPPDLAPTPDVNRTRTGKNFTELDFQNVLRESERLAREEQERRDLIANSKPNYEMEAEVPAMLDNSEIDAMNFEDTNHIVPAQLSCEMFEFLPPQDDFTGEEQKSFAGAFSQTPKKWGKIAESLPGRDYQQCILHYYLTKDIAKYKESVRKAQGGRKRPKEGHPPSQEQAHLLLICMMRKIPT